MHGIGTLLSKRQEVRESDGKYDMKDDKTSLEILEYKH